MTDHSTIIGEMSAELGLLPDQLRRVIRTAPLRYKKFLIQKKNGSFREVAQPAREVKLIQRWIIKRFNPVLPVHDAVTAYRVGSSIRDNAERHLCSNFLLKMDFEDFFPSILEVDVFRHLVLHCKEYSEADLKYICRACLWTPNRSPPLRLCIGAPSSPMISNSILNEFDAALVKVIGPAVRYTRYADDLTFSADGKGLLNDVETAVYDAVRELESPKLKINDKKTVHASRAGRRSVTGLVLTPDFRLSVGRDRKRAARAMYHRASTGALSAKELQRLNGILAFIDSIEPGFSAKLRGGAEI